MVYLKIFIIIIHPSNAVQIHIGLFFHQFSGFIIFLEVSFLIDVLYLFFDNFTQETLINQSRGYNPHNTDLKVVQEVFLDNLRLTLSHHIQCTVYRVQCTVYSVQCTEYSVQCTVYILLKQNPRMKKKNEYSCLSLNILSDKIIVLL